MKACSDFCRLAAIIVIALCFTACKKSTEATTTTNTSTSAISGTRYRDSVFSNITTSSNITFGQNTTIGGAATNLLLDYYQPANDTVRKPLIILVYGGGFVGGDKTVLAALAKRFTHYGYAAACTSYRLYDGATPASNNQLKTEILMGMQDIKATVRFFKKDAATTKIYKIDTTKIIILGHSAGAMIVLHTAYANSIAKITATDAALLNIVNANGGIEGNSGSSGYSSNVKAVINLAGSLLFKNYIGATDIPLLSIYGTNDTLMPISDGTFSLPVITGIAVSGSVSLQARANAVNLNNTLYAIPGGDHFAPTTDNTAFGKMISFIYGEL